MSDATLPLPGMPGGEQDSRPVETSSPEYYSLHGQLRHRRGPARKQRCAQCDGPADDWARLHDKSGRDIWADYVPMCTKCHMAYDLGGVPKSDGHRAKLVDYALNRPAEHLQKLSEAAKANPSRGMQGKHHSEESRQKTRAALAGRKPSQATVDGQKRYWAARRAAAGGVTDGTPRLDDGQDSCLPGPEAGDAA